MNYDVLGINGKPNQLTNNMLLINLIYARN